jgi:hypothetical protein
MRAGPDTGACVLFLIKDADIGGAPAVPSRRERMGTRESGGRRVPFGAGVQEEQEERSTGERQGGSLIHPAGVRI